MMICCSKKKNNHSLRVSEDQDLHNVSVNKGCCPFQPCSWHRLQHRHADVSDRLLTHPPMGVSRQVAGAV